MNHLSSCSRQSRETIFRIRLAELRTQAGVSARDMSLSIGQNPGYINNIESGKSLPSMTGFFCICEYLNLSPKEFFDYDTAKPSHLDHLVQKLKEVSPDQISALETLINGLLED